MEEEEEKDKQDVKGVNTDGDENHVELDEKHSEEKPVKWRNVNDGVQLAACHSLQGVSCHSAGRLSHSSGLPRVHIHAHTHARTRIKHTYSGHE